MVVHSYFQLIDQYLVAQLKIKKFGEIGEQDKVDVAREESEIFQAAIHVYEEEVRLGIRIPRVKVNNRFHDHAKIEGRELIAPDTLDGVKNRLFASHEEYWNFQTELNECKGMLSDEGNVFLPLEIQGAREKFVRIQREIDLRNQERNFLIEVGDKMYAESING